jgi:hypothetical protein
MLGMHYRALSSCNVVFWHAAHRARRQVEELRAKERYEAYVREQAEKQRRAAEDKAEAAAKAEAERIRRQKVTEEILARQVSPGAMCCVCGLEGREGNLVKQFVVHAHQAVAALLPCVWQLAW